MCFENVFVINKRVQGSMFRECLERSQNDQTNIGICPQFLISHSKPIVDHKKSQKYHNNYAQIPTIAYLFAVLFARDTPFWAQSHRFCLRLKLDSGMTELGTTSSVWKHTGDSQKTQM